MRQITHLSGVRVDVNNSTMKHICSAIRPKGRIAIGRPGLALGFWHSHCNSSGGAGAAPVAIVLKLISLFTSLLAIPLARQSCLDAFLLTGLQVVGVTLNFLDNVFLLNLPLKPAESIFERLALLYANLCQRIPPPNLPSGFFRIL